MSDFFAAQKVEIKFRKKYKIYKIYHLEGEEKTGVAKLNQIKKFPKIYFLNIYLNMVRIIISQVMVLIKKCTKMTKILKFCRIFGFQDLTQNFYP